MVASLRFRPTIWIKDRDSIRTVATVSEAIAFLRVYPQASRDDAHSKTAEIVLQAARGIASVEDARLAFRQFAKEAGILGEADPL